MPAPCLTSLLLSPDTKPCTLGRLNIPAMMEEGYALSGAVSRMREKMDHEKMDHEKMDNEAEKDGKVKQEGKKKAHGKKAKVEEEAKAEEEEAEEEEEEDADAHSSSGSDSSDSGLDSEPNPEDDGVVVASKANRAERMAKRNERNAETEKKEETAKKAEKGAQVAAAEPKGQVKVTFAAGPADEAAPKASSGKGISAASWRNRAGGVRGQPASIAAAGPSARPFTRGSSK